MQVELRQRGRASLDFLAQLGGALRRARGAVTDELSLAENDLPDDFALRLAVFEGALKRAPAYPYFAALRAWYARTHGPVAIESFEEVRATLQPMLREMQNGPTTLEPTLGDALPDYHRGVAFHGTGPWDGHDQMGFVHGELIHRRLVARNFGGDIYAQRRGMLDELDGRQYARILELGTSSGNHTMAISQRFPAAAVSGIDLSLRMLEQAQRVGNQHGLAWQLHQRAAESTGFPDQSFDLVTGYALGHEVPAHVFDAILKESWRVLAPGGELLLGDVVPFLAQDKLTQCWAQHEAVHGGEPYWRDYCSRDLAAVATEAGFERARYFGQGPHQHPFVLHARKPGRTDAA